MSAEEDVALGVECAWTPVPEEPDASRAWLLVLAALLAVGTWLVARGAWAYVLLAFFS